MEALLPPATSTRTGKSSAFTIPRSVILQSGDINPPGPEDPPLEYKAGDTYVFAIDQDSFKGKRQIASELGWLRPGMTQHGTKKKTKLNRGDIFYSKADKSIVRINQFDEADKHKVVGDCSGRPTCHIFKQSGLNQYKLVTSKVKKFVERDHRYVRPDRIKVTNGRLGSQMGLEINFDLTAYIASTESLNDLDLYITSVNKDLSLDHVLGNLPMFREEKPLAFKILHESGMFGELSPKTYAEIAGRGIEYSNGKSKFTFRDRCTHTISKMESEIRHSFSLQVQSAALVSKYERRVRGHMRSYRIGVMSKDLEKMTDDIKSHRNMIDSYTSFVKSDKTDDETDCSPHRSPSFLPRLISDSVDVLIPVVNPSSYDYLPSFLHLRCPSHHSYSFVPRTVATSESWPPWAAPLSFC